MKGERWKGGPLVAPRFTFVAFGNFCESGLLFYLCVFA